MFSKKITFILKRSKKNKMTETKWPSLDSVEKKLNEAKEDFKFLKAASVKVGKFESLVPGGITKALGGSKSDYVYLLDFGLVGTINELVEFAEKYPELLTVNEAESALAIDASNYQTAEMAATIDRLTEDQKARKEEKDMSRDEVIHYLQQFYKGAVVAEVRNEDGTVKTAAKPGGYFVRGKRAGDSGRSRQPRKSFEETLRTKYENLPAGKQIKIREVNGEFKVDVGPITKNGGQTYHGINPNVPIVATSRDTVTRAFDILGLTDNRGDHNKDNTVKTG